MAVVITTHNSTAMVAIVITVDMATVTMATAAMVITIPATVTEVITTVMTIMVTEAAIVAVGIVKSYSVARFRLNNRRERAFLIFLFYRLAVLHLRERSNNALSSYSL